MSAGYQDIFLNQGETFTTTLSLADPNGTPYDLNHFLVASSAKKSYYSSNASIIFETTVLVVPEVKPINGKPIVIVPVTLLNLTLFEVCEFT